MPVWHTQVQLCDSTLLPRCKRDLCTSDMLQSMDRYLVTFWINLSVPPSGSSSPTNNNEPTMCKTSQNSEDLQYSCTLPTGRHHSAHKHKMGLECIHLVQTGPVHSEVQSTQGFLNSAC